MYILPEKTVFAAKKNTFSAEAIQFKLFATT